MQISWDINVASLFTLLLAGLGFARYCILNEQRAIGADKRAAAAEEKADKAHEKIAMLQALVNANQITQAERLVSREVLREVEERLAGSIEKLGDRLDSLLREVIQHRRE